jgi:hypothetical protein
MEQNLQEYLVACRDAEAIVYAPVGFLGYYIARAQGALRVGAALYPLFSRTRYFPSSVIPIGTLRPRQAFSGPYNYLTYLFSEQLFWQSFRAPASRAIKKHLRLSTAFWGPFGELRRRREPILYGSGAPAFCPNRRTGGNGCTPPVAGSWSSPRGGNHHGG